MSLPGPQSCVYVELQTPSHEPFFKYRFDSAMCAAISEAIAADLNTAAEVAGAVLPTPFEGVDCSGQEIKVRCPRRFAWEGRAPRNK